MTVSFLHVRLTLIQDSCLDSAAYRFAVGGQAFRFGKGHAGSGKNGAGFFRHELVECGA
jgi:hypothetical protein